MYPLHPTPENPLDQLESVPSVLESAATGEIAEIYADIRKPLGSGVVNLIWRNLASLPGALQWTWATVRPLYVGSAPLHAEAVRRNLPLPSAPLLSADALTAAGIDRTALSGIRAILDSYHHTNALALVVLSALLEHFDPTATDVVQGCDAVPLSVQTELPALPPMATLSSEVRRLIAELNEFGEDGAP